MGSRSKQKKGNVFSFFDGVKNRRVDFLRTLTELEKKVSITALANTQDIAEIGKLVAAVRAVWNVPEFSEEDENTLSDGDVAEIFLEFMEASDDLKKNTKPKPTLPSVTVPQS